MKNKILGLLMILTICMASSVTVSQAQTPTSPEVGKEIRAKLRLTYKESDGKRCPANEYMEISYFYGNISVTSMTQGETVRLTIESSNTGEFEEVYFFKSGEYVQVMLNTGQYFLSLELSDGRVFCGEMYVE